MDSDTAKEYFICDPEAGQLIWLPRSEDKFINAKACVKWNTNNAWQVAGKYTPQGYLTVQIKQGIYMAHRVIWLMVYGEWPEITDHINGIKDDNRLINLRSVNSRDNSRNRKVSVKNKTGTPGVYWCKTKKKWCAQIRGHDGKIVSLGRFMSVEEAARARKTADVEYGYHPNHGRL